MEIKDIRAFLMIASEGSFTRAAEKLYITQPALSRKIADLESELKVELIRRRGKTIELTEDGLFFQRRARQLDRDYNNLMTEIGSLHNGKNLRLNIAYGMAGHIEYLAEALRALRKRNSLVAVKAERMFNSDVLAGIEDGSLDCGIINLPELREDSDLAKATLLPCGLCAFFYRGHPLFNRSSVKLADLADQNYITFERHTSPNQYDYLMKLCRKNGLPENPLICAPDTSTFSLLMCTRQVVGLMPYTTTVYDNPNIRKLPVTDTESFDMVMVWKKDHENPAIQLLNECF